MKNKEYIDCELCDSPIVANEIFIISHYILDITCALLFILKMFSWMFWQSFKIGKMRSFPCRCSHKAFWHVVNFKGTFPALSEITWFSILFYYKFKKDEKNSLSHCLRCLFRINHYDSNKYPCDEFHPLNNLTYLEKIYKKKSK